MTTPTRERLGHTMGQSVKRLMVCSLSLWRSPDLQLLEVSFSRSQHFPLHSMPTRPTWFAQQRHSRQSRDQLTSSSWSTGAPRTVLSTLFRELSWIQLCLD
jgi:hypothetical protein